MDVLELLAEAGVLNSVDEVKQYLKKVDTVSAAYKAQALALTGIFYFDSTSLDKRLTDRSFIKRHKALTEMSSSSSSDAAKAAGAKDEDTSQTEAASASSFPLFDKSTLTLFPPNTMASVPSPANGAPGPSATDSESAGNGRAPTRPMKFAPLQSTKRGCRCKRSRCLKFYCECFAANQYCAENVCICVDCWNTTKEEHKDARANAVVVAMSKHNSRTQAGGSSAVNSGAKPQGQTPAVVRQIPPCNCRRSNCLKRYCDCFAAGRVCTSKCRCIDCENKTTSTMELFVDSDGEEAYEIE